MPITKDINGKIVYTPIEDNLRFEETGVITDESFSICDNTNVLKQIQFLINPTSTAPGVLTLQVDISGDTTVNLTDVLAGEANMPTQTIKGRITAGTGAPEDLTATQATSILNAMVGDSGSGGTKGLVPAPGTGDATKYLKGDGTWASVPAAYTDEQAQDAIGSMLQGSATKVQLTYTDGTPELKAEIVSGSLVNADINASAAIVESKLSLDFSTSSLNTAVGTKVSKSGDTMSGNLAMGTNKVTGLGAPTTNGDALRYNELGANNGIATLDSGGKVPVAQLPNAVMTYEGVWNASTNSPTLIDGTGSAGMVYRVSTSGTQDLGSGSISFTVGDYVIYNGSIWEKSDTTDAVASVNGQTGIVVLDTGDLSEDTNLFFTDERAQDAIGAMIADTTTIDITYTDGTPELKADVKSDSIDNTLLANMATQTIKGRTTAGTGDPEDLTATQATAILNNMVGDSGSGGTKGLVPAPSAGDAAAGKYLKADGVWTTIPASYTDEQAQDAVGAMIADTATIDLTYTDGTPELKADVKSNSITNAMLVDVSTATFKGRTTAGTGSPEDLTATQATALLNNMVGDSGSGGTKGLVPAPASGDAAAGKFLKADGTWVAPSGGGVGSAAPVIKSADYTLVSGDNGKVIAVDTSSSALTITLPAPTSAYKITIKDYKGNAATNPILVKRASTTEKLDNADSDDLISDAYGAVSYISDGTDWYRITKYTGSIVAALGVFQGGLTGVDVNTIDYITITSASNATNFGNLSVTRHGTAGLGSGTRAHAAGGQAGGASNVIDYIVFTTTGNATDFGDLSVARYYAAGAGSSTRGIIAGGDTGAVSNVIDYITYASAGNATDFGDLTVSRALGGGSGVNSSTRAVFGGGNYATSNVIDYITIASTGNATDFGDLTVNRNYASGASSSTRGLFLGGETATAQNVVDYITIASTGNATDFGDLSAGRFQMGALASEIRAVTGGGLEGGVVNTMDYFTIASTGNATDFGDLTQARRFIGGASNSHGGLR